MWAVSRVKCSLAARKAGDEGRAVELLGQALGRGRQHDLARQPRQHHAPGVVQIGQPLGVALVAAADVGKQHHPVRAKELVYQVAQRGDVAQHLLQRDHVKAADQLGDQGQRPQVALGAAGVLRPVDQLHLTVSRGSFNPSRVNPSLVTTIARVACSLNIMPSSWCPGCAAPDRRSSACVGRETGRSKSQLLRPSYPILGALRFAERSHPRLQLTLPALQPRRGLPVRVARTRTGGPAQGWWDQRPAISVASASSQSVRGVRLLIQHAGGLARR